MAIATPTGKLPWNYRGPLGKMDSILYSVQFIDVPQPKRQERQKTVLSPTPASVRQKSHLILIKLM